MTERDLVDVKALSDPETEDYRAVDRIAEDTSIGDLRTLSSLRRLEITENAMFGRSSSILGDCCCGKDVREGDPMAGSDFPAWHDLLPEGLEPFSLFTHDEHIDREKAAKLLQDPMASQLKSFALIARSGVRRTKHSDDRSFKESSGAQEEASEAETQPQSEPLGYRTS